MNLYLELNETTNRVVVLVIYWNGSQFWEYLAPQRVIEELGLPSEVLVKLNQSERADLISFRLVMAYPDRSIWFRYSAEANVDLSKDRIEVCPSSKSLNTGSIVIGESVYGSLDLSEFRPFGEVFGTTLSASLIDMEQGGNVCWTAKLSAGF